MAIHPRLHEITERIRARSLATRTAYLAAIEAARGRGPHRGHLSCGNLAHGFAVAEGADKARIAAAVTPNLGIVTAFNEMLSAHAPYER